MQGIKLDDTKKVIKLKVNNEELAKIGLQIIVPPSIEYNYWTFIYTSGKYVNATGQVTVVIEPKKEIRK